MRGGRLRRSSEGEHSGSLGTFYGTGKNREQFGGFYWDLGILKSFQGEVLGHSGAGKGLGEVFWVSGGVLVRVC